MASLDSSVQLLVAALDLNLVKLLRDAIRTTETGGGSAAVGPLGTFQQPRPARRDVFEPQPRIEQRRVFHPQPRFEPRAVECVSRKEAECPAQAKDACPPIPETAVAEAKSCRSPIQPPWRVRLWETPVPPRPVIKVVVQRPDIISKGSLLDLFI